MQSEIREWQYVCDYEDEPEKLQKIELRSLSAVWEEQRDLLSDQEALGRFTEKLKREWAIETGLIERLYEFDRGITEVLIERGFDSTFLPHGRIERPEKVISIIRDQKEAIESVFDYVKQERALSTSYVKEIHALLTRNQEFSEGKDQFGNRIEAPLNRGDYKKQHNNPTRADGTAHCYCPPEHVSAEMDRLIDMHSTHVKVMPEVESAWLHHRFVQIHPFQDGNGRVARALATLVFLKERWFPLVIKDSDRDRYIAALEAADHGKLDELIALFAALQKEQFVLALGLARDVLQENRAEEIIVRTGKELRRRKDALKKEWETARDKAEALRIEAMGSLEKLVLTLESQIEPAVEKSVFFVDGAADHETKSHYFHRQIVETAKTLNYFANTSSYRSWVRIVLKTDSHGEILISFHGIGYEFRGILACTATWFQRVDTEDGEREVTSATALSDDVFQVNYKEDLDQISDRFKIWLDDSVITGLNVWQKSVL